MPLYDVECHKCGSVQEIFRKYEDYDDLPECCGERTTRKFCAPRVMSDIQPYFSQATGTMITSRSQHRNHLKDNGLIEVGNEKMPGENREYKAPSETRKKIIAEQVHNKL